MLTDLSAPVDFLSTSLHTFASNAKPSITTSPNTLKVMNVMIFYIMVLQSNPLTPTIIRPFHRATTLDFHTKSDILKPSDTFF